MLFAFVVIAVLILFIVLGYNAYLIWYARSGCYELHQRLDAVTKR